MRLFRELSALLAQPTEWSRCVHRGEWYVKKGPQRYERCGPLRGF